MDTYILKLRKELSFMENQERKNKWKILCLVLMGPLIATIDASIVNVALPDMATKLSASIDTIQWVVTSYLIVISALILMFGRIGDLIGKSKVFHRGFIIFSLGSLLCSLSNTVEFLIISRVIQAIGASMIMSSNQGIIADTFLPNERGKALGLLGSTVAIGTMLGPPIGGFLVQFFSWQYIFIINIPIGLIAFIAGLKILPKENKSGSIKDLDYKGSVLFMVFIVCIFWALSSGEKLGWSNIYILSSFIISIISIVLFYFAENRIKNPMIQFSIFKNTLFDISLLCAFISFTVIFCNNIIYPFYLQYVMKVSPSMSGLFMVVFPIFAGLVSPISGYISDKIGGEIPTFLGLFLTVIGLVVLSSLNMESNYFHIVLGVAFLGIGNGLFQSPNNSLIMSLVSTDKLGIAGSINALVRNMGMVFGASISVVLLYNRMSYKIGYKVTNFIPSRPDVFIYSMKIVYLIAALFCTFAIILSLSRILVIKKKKS
jgi:EmrB/QacA subfamily drug resistance transporter